jgi:cytochrome c oxidase cbb3-type subunit III
MKARISCAMLAAALLCAIGCKREQRVFDPGSSQDQIANANAQNEIHAGVQWAPGPPSSPSDARYDESAYAVAEGKRLFQAFNCVGCHQYGGGGIGPALMDSQWIYGSHPAEIYADIVQGTPNGMPSFSGKIPDYQVWELVAYVRSLSGQLRADVAPARSDHMPVTKAEQARPKEHPSDETQQKRQP